MPALIAGLQYAQHFSLSELSNNLWVIVLEIPESPLSVKAELLSLYTVVHVSSQLF